MTEKIVLALSGGGANNAIQGMIEEYTSPLRDLGLSVVNVKMEPAELQVISVSLLVRHRVDHVIHTETNSKV